MNDDDFTKIYGGRLLTSSVWLNESSDTRVVWITLLASADSTGEVHMSPLALARMAVVDRAAVEVALEKFLSPDPDSRDKDNDGRRIECIDGGWRILNHGAYRERRTKKQIQTAERVRRHRDSSVTCNACNAAKHEVTGVTTEAEAEAEAENNPPISSLAPEPVVVPTPQAADEEASPDHPEKALVQVEDEIRAAWNAVAAERPGWAQCTKRPSGEVGRMLRARCRDPDWLRDYPEALRRFGAMKWVTKGRFATILRPDSVRKLMDKEWTDDDNKRDLYQPSADWVPP